MKDDITVLRLRKYGIETEKGGHLSDYLEKTSTG